MSGVLLLLYFLLFLRSGKLTLFPHLFLLFFYFYSFFFSQFNFVLRRREELWHEQQRRLCRCRISTGLAQPSVSGSQADGLSEGRSVNIMDETLRYHIRLPKNENEMYQVAILRAECYYEVGVLDVFIFFVPELIRN